MNDASTPSDLTSMEAARWAADVISAASVYASAIGGDDILRLARCIRREAEGDGRWHNIASRRSSSARGR